MISPTRMDEGFADALEVDEYSIMDGWILTVKTKGQLEYSSLGRNHSSGSASSRRNHRLNELFIVRLHMAVAFCGLCLKLVLFITIFWIRLTRSLNQMVNWVETERKFVADVYVRWSESKRRLKGLRGWFQESPLRAGSATCFCCAVNITRSSRNAGECPEWSIMVLVWCDFVTSFGTDFLSSLFWKELQLWEVYLVAATGLPLDRLAKDYIKDALLHVGLAFAELFFSTRFALFSFSLFHCPSVHPVTSVSILRKRAPT